MGNQHRFDELEEETKDQILRVQRLQCLRRGFPYVPCTKVTPPHFRLRPVFQKTMTLFSLKKNPRPNRNVVHRFVRTRPTIRRRNFSDCQTNIILIDTSLCFSVTFTRLYLRYFTKRIYCDMFYF